MHSIPSEMKTVEMLPSEFYEFVKIAKRLQIKFIYQVIHGIVLVEADLLQLEDLGY